MHCKGAPVREEEGIIGTGTGTVTFYRKLDVAIKVGSVVTAAKDGADPELSDGIFVKTTPSTVVLNIEDNAYS